MASSDGLTLDSTLDRFQFCELGHGVLVIRTPSTEEQLDEYSSELLADQTIDEEVYRRIQRQHQVSDGVDVAVIISIWRQARDGRGEIDGYPQDHVWKLAYDEDADNNDQHEGDVLAVLGRLDRGR